jgi:hypothetical protein
MQQLIGELVVLEKKMAEELLTYGDVRARINWFVSDAYKRINLIKNPVKDFTSKKNKNDYCIYGDGQKESKWDATKEN